MPFSFVSSDRFLAEDASVGHWHGLPARVGGHVTSGAAERRRLALARFYNKRDAVRTSPFRRWFQRRRPMTSASEQRPMRVAVVGAGAAGLVACRHLAARPDTFSVACYEQTSSIGGTWVYDESTESDDYGLPRHSSMYKNLRIILPKEIMAFLDYDFPPGPPSYVHREAVLKYLNDYCDHFDLRRLIELDTRVVRVSPRREDDGVERWTVELERLATKERRVQEFDAIVVCNGHYFNPKYPEIDDFEKFSGEALHSHDFRDPAMFAGKNVLCLGAGASGLDISLQAAALANKVYLSYKPPHVSTASFPNTVEVLPYVRSADVGGFHFEDGSFRSVDTVVFCTGYHYSFPFLSSECGVVVRQRRVLNLYKQVINIDHPTMSILSVPLFTVPFPLSDVQAQFVAETLAHPERLPSANEMRADTHEHMERLLDEGWPPRFFHRLEEKMWDYMEELIELAELPVRIPPWRKELHRISFRKRMQEFATFRNLNYIISGTGVTYQ